MPSRVTLTFDNGPTPGVTERVHEVLHRHTHRYPHGLEVALEFVRCTLDPGAFHCSEAVHEWRWVRPADVTLDGVLEADRDFLRSLGATG